MNDSLRRAARRALKPNAIIMGVAACLSGWSLAEAFGPYEGHFAHLKFHYAYLAGVFFGLLVAAAALSTRKPLGNLIAVALSAPYPTLLFEPFSMLRPDSEGRYLSAENVGHWVSHLSYMPPAVWLMAALATAILCSAAATTLRQKPPRP